MTKKEMKHVVSFSGGLGSWAAAKRVAEEHGTENLYLVFCNTKIEDEDLYKFLEVAAKDVGGTYVQLEDGRHIWQVFDDVSYIGNTRTAHCSTKLKSDPFYAWIDEQGRDDCIVYLGIDWSEVNRLDRARENRPEYRIEAPLCEGKLLEKEDIIEMLKQAGIELPRLYKMGFAHNNCGGACVRAGQAQWAKLYKEMPERYKWHEEQMEDLMKRKPKTRPFLRKTIKGVVNYLTLKEFRESLEANVEYDKYDIGGCACLTE